MHFTVSSSDYVSKRFSRADVCVSKVALRSFSPTWRLIICMFWYVYVLIPYIFWYCICFDMYMFWYQNSIKTCTCFDTTRIKTYTINPLHNLRIQRRYERKRRALLARDVCHDSNPSRNFASALTTEYSVARRSQWVTIASIACAMALD